MLLKRWEPFAGLTKMDTDMDRMWRHMFRPHYTWPRLWGVDGHPAVDIYQDADHVVVRAALPGIKPEDMEVTITEDALTIKGERKDEKEVKEENYLHREHRYGAFRRAVALPLGLDAAKAKASYENGILTVTVPKTEGSRPKSLKIDVES